MEKLMLYKLVDKFRVQTITTNIFMLWKFVCYKEA